MAPTLAVPTTAGRLALTWFESPVGPLLLGAGEDGVCLLEFRDRDSRDDQVAAVTRRLGLAAEWSAHSLTDRLGDELRQYFAGNLRRFTVPIDFPGTPFQVRVWEALLGIPYGETRSYGQLARQLGMEGAQRALGHANGQNPIAIVIPCHRVVAHDGGLGGYGGGLWRKRFLLDLESGQTGIADPVLTAD
jgi:AraC family transcriptional regulator of adaptative response/methylated-DNA-[protein]-cysteine methyltransferase